MKIIYESEQMITETIYDYIDSDELEKELQEINKNLVVHRISETKLRVYYAKKSFLTIDIVFNPELSFILEDYKGNKYVSSYNTLKDDIIKGIKSEL